MGAEMEREGQIAEMVLVLFARWALPYSQQCALLQVDSLPTPAVGGFQVFSVRIKGRAVRFLEIHACLRTLFPNDIDLAYRWMNQENLAFESKPIDYIISYGDVGIDKVINYLKLNFN